MDRAEFSQICHDGVDAGFIFSGPVRPNTVEAFKAVKEMGHTIVIITDRQFGCSPTASHQATRVWLAENGIEYDELHFSADKLIVPTDCFVEDKLENYDILTAAGTPCVLIDRPWNQDGNDTRLRINDIGQYPPFVSLVADLHKNRLSMV